MPDIAERNFFEINCYALLFLSDYFGVDARETTGKFLAFS